MIDFECIEKDKEQTTKIIEFLKWLFPKEEK